MLTPEEALEQAVLAGIHRLRIPTPFAVGRVNCYLLEDEPLTLIDTGPNSGKALDELQGQLAQRGHSIDDLELVILTHQHIDHLGLVEILVEHSGAEVDPARRPLVYHCQQVLGRVDDVVGDAEGATDDVGRAAGQHRDWNVRAGEAVGNLVQGAVAAEGDDDVVSVIAYLAADLSGVVLRLGGDGLDLVTALQRIDDQVLEPVGDGRRVGVDDQQHPLLGAAASTRPPHSGSPPRPPLRERALR